MEVPAERARDHLEESMHFLMINVLVDSFEVEGFTVSADHVGGARTRPAPIAEYVPDIDARRGDERYLIEVETQSTLESDRAREQMRILASQTGARRFIAVPCDCVEAARKVRRGFEGEVGILPCYPFVRYVGIPK
jgi:hypothetical protein